MGMTESHATVALASLESAILVIRDAVADNTVTPLEKKVMGAKLADALEKARLNAAGDELAHAAKHCKTPWRINEKMAKYLALAALVSDAPPQA